MSRIFIPICTLLTAIVLWEVGVRMADVPPVLLPRPSAIFATLVQDWSMLSRALWVTLSITAEALLAATLGGVLLALVFSRFSWLQQALWPFVLILQVTPVIAIAPLILVCLDTQNAVLVCAFLVAFFPILTNTMLGLSCIDPHLLDIFRLHHASPSEQMFLLRIPSALPYFLGGLRISGSLALIGAITADIAAGSSGQGSGLAYRIVESGYRLNIPRMFAALVLISLTGLIIDMAVRLLSYSLLYRWHESAHTPD